VETSLPTLTTARVYVNLLEGKESLLFIGFPSPPKNSIGGTDPFPVEKKD
jgi:hypothetical protein